MPSRPTPPQASPTVTQRFAQALEQAALQLGIHLPPVAVSPDNRVALADLDRLWDTLCASPDPLIGIRMGLALQVGHLDITGLLLMSCEHYGESLECLREYAPLIGGGIGFHLLPQGELQQLRVEAQYAVREAQRLEAVIALILQLSRSNTGGHFAPSRILFRHRPLDAEQRYQDLLGCPVVFEADVDALEFHQDALALTLVQANPAMRVQLARLADESLAALGEHSLSFHVTRYIRQQPGWSKEKIAEQLHMSGRHLTRKLAEEGFSFRQLHDRELLAMAQQALAGAEKIQDIAWRLGFSDESAFAKAFRRWTGKAPSEYRH